jgi:hypothetical protein
VVVGAAALACVLAGCGGGSSTPAPATTHAAAATPSACSAATAAAVARRLGVPAGTVTASPYIATTAAPSCRYATRVAGVPVSVTVSIDTAGQAYYRLERQAVEDGQQFASQREAPVPQDVPGIGLDADWFPVEMNLVTADARRLITVAATWPGRDVAVRRAIAEAVARAALAQRP